MGLKDIEHDEMTPATIKYIIKDIGDKQISNHSDVLIRLGVLEGKIDALNKNFNTHLIEDAKSETRFEERLNTLTGKVNGTFVWLGAISIALVAGIFNFLLSLLKK